MGFSVCRLEADSDRISYTYQTMEELSKAHPDKTFFFIMGADSFMDFPKWRFPERIAKTASLLVAAREEFGRARLEEQECFIKTRFPVIVQFLMLSKIPVSSSQIREQIRIGRSTEKLLNPRVLDYIREHGLYR